MAAESVYRSKIDSWLVAILAVAGVTSGYAVVVDLRAAPARDAALSALPLALAAVSVVWLFVSTRYILRNDELVVRTGPCRWRIALRDIAEVAPTRNPLSSPALSLDRLRITYGSGKSIMISPRDKRAFLRELDARRKAVGR